MENRKYEKWFDEYLKAQAALMRLVNSLEEKGKLYRMAVDCMID